jgi:hypothetical protein
MMELFANGLLVVQFRRRAPKDTRQAGGFPLGGVGAPDEAAEHPFGLRALDLRVADRLTGVFRRATSKLDDE